MLGVPGDAQHRAVPERGPVALACAFRTAVEGTATVGGSGEPVARHGDAIVIVPLLAVAASAVVWGLVYRSLVHHPLDAMALTLYYLALQLLWRPLMLAAGLDTPFPTPLFETRDTESLILLGQAVVVGFLLALWAGARLLSPFVRPVSVLFPQFRGPMSPRTLVLLAVVLTAVAFVATAALWVR